MPAKAFVVFSLNIKQLIIPSDREKGKIFLSSNIGFQYVPLSWVTFSSMNENHQF